MLVAPMAAYSAAVVPECISGQKKLVSKILIRVTCRGDYAIDMEAELS